MKTTSSSQTSLAQHVTHLLVTNPENDWLKALHIDDSAATHQISHHLNLATKNEIAPENLDMAASRFAKALLPALLNHSIEDPHLIISIKIHTASEPIVDKGNVILDQALGFDLSALRNTVISGLNKLGMHTDSTSFYNIELGGKLFRIITVHGQLGTTNFTALNTWRQNIKKEFDIHVRFREKQNSSQPRFSAQESNLSLATLNILAKNYALSARKDPIPAALAQRIEDWRDLDFMSIDSAQTRRPEDIISLVRTKNNHIILRTAIPFSTNREAFYSPYKDIISIGVTQEFDRWGGIVSHSISPAIVHNSFALDSYTVSCVASKTPFSHNSYPSSNSQIGQRIASIRENSVLADQIDLFYDLADRIVSKQTEPGHAISFHLTRDHYTIDRHHTMASQCQTISSDYLISAISKLTQHTIAQWALTQPGPQSLIALRPEFSPNRTIDAIKNVIPNFTNDDLLHPTLLHQLGMSLFRGGHHRLNQSLAELLESGPRRQRLILLSSGETVVPDDRIRIKSIHSGVGKANNLQIQSILLGLPPLSDHVLRGVIGTIRNDSPQNANDSIRSTIARDLEMVNTQIRLQLEKF